MILQSLYEYYRRKVNLGSVDAAPEGFEWKALPFLVVIDGSGNFLSIEDTREESAPKGKKFLLPRAEQRPGSKGWATTNLLWDHIGYVFGFAKLGSDEAKNARSQELAKRQHGTWLASIEQLDRTFANDDAIAAIAKFYSSGEDQRVRDSDKWAECIRINGCNVSFRLDGDAVVVPCRDSVQQFVRSQLQSGLGDDQPDKEAGDRPLVGRCLITGDVGLIARLHIKTPINKDCNTLVGFQRNSGYDSYGKEQAYNAPVSQSAESAYTTALKMMLAEGSHNRIRIGDTVTLFWSAGTNQLENDFPFFWQPAPGDNPDRGIQAIQALLESPYYGATIPEERMQFYVLGLAPGGGSRISIRYWHPGTVEELSQKLRRHFRDLEVIKPKGDRGNCALFYLLRDIALENKIDNIPPSVAGDTMRAILSGGPYPTTLLQQAMRHIRATRDVKRTQAALLKAYLNRESQSKTQTIDEEFHVSLDPDNNNQGYLLGRLFAVLEKIQIDALGDINAGIRERFYGAASSSPVVVFSRLLNLKNHHLAKLESQAIRVAHEKRLTEIFAGLVEFPAHLSLEDQARFAIGYYHQRQAFYTKAPVTDSTPS